MLPLYHDRHFTFRFAGDRLIPRFHPEGVEAGQRVSIFKIDPGTGERRPPAPCFFPAWLPFRPRRIGASVSPSP